jgi:hypothetical protein
MTEKYYNFEKIYSNNFVASKLLLNLNNIFYSPLKINN